MPRNFERGEKKRNDERRKKGQKNVAKLEADQRASYGSGCYTTGVQCTCLQDYILSLALHLEFGRQKDGNRKIDGFLTLES
jgi:hypothetical protein